MSNPTSFVAARSEVERARELLAMIRANPNGTGLNDALSQLDAALSAASSHIGAAERHFNELSSAVVVGNVRHF